MSQKKKKKKELKAILLCCHKLRHPDGTEMLKVTVWILSIYILKLQVVLDSVAEDFLHWKLHKLLDKYLNGAYSFKYSSVTVSQT